MKNAAVAFAVLASSADAEFLKPRAEYEALFFEHTERYGLTFANGAEWVKRLEIFAAKDDEINTHNAGDWTYTLGHNAYSHLSWPEFQAMFHLGKDTIKPKPSLNRQVYTEAQAQADLAALARTSGVGIGALHIDWEHLGKVTPVKNQGSCGSCWSFSATGSMEGSYAIVNNLNISEWEGFSEQELVSCDHNGDEGCNGGFMDTAFQWVMDNGGICSETAYPYTSGGGADGACLLDIPGGCKSLPGSAPNAFVDVQPGSSAALEAAVHKQPVSVAIQANQVAFQSYSGGVLTGKCGNNLDHGVLAVGYGTWTDDTTKYWKVKNSWGSSWGMAGYILIEKGSTINECGILDAASYPNMTKTLGPR